MERNSEESERKIGAKGQEINGDNEKTKRRRIRRYKVSCSERGR